MAQMNNLNPQQPLPIIPIRNGSKGLPNKNITLLAGKPLYLYTVEQALRLFGQCVVSTDIASVLESDLPDNCLILKRPDQLSQDTTPMDDVLLHVLDELRKIKMTPDLCLLLQATSPLRLDEDVQKAVAFYKAHDFELVQSVSPVDPGFLKFGSVGQDGKFLPVSKPQYCFSNRQDLPQMVRPNGAVYVFSAKTFSANGGLACHSIGAVQTEHSIDIDIQDDLLRAEKYLHEQSN